MTNSKVYTRRRAPRTVFAWLLNGGKGKGRGWRGNTSLSVDWRLQDCPSLARVGRRKRLPHKAGVGRRKRLPHKAGVGRRKRLPHKAGVGRRKRLPHKAGVGRRKRLPHKVGVGRRKRLPHKVGVGRRKRLPHKVGIEKERELGLSVAGGRGFADLSPCVSGRHWIERHFGGIRIAGWQPGTLRFVHRPTSVPAAPTESPCSSIPDYPGPEEPNGSLQTGPVRS